ncbi:hypothetical protein [Arthrobacter sp. 260]|uniref:hypothetical protein n=1 Tax=Arthrobacter sp. 260 TaxID=2735314 RepID=UPI00149222F0|nr:hypothetical protein [Arthrobacter sp. 260]NOJ58977.1 hypothetical protein [Arthrobacter sp. 260]
MSDQPSRRDLRKNRRDTRRNKELLSALHQETDLQREDVSLRTGMMSTRASILVAAASLSTALQSGQQGLFFVAAIWLSVLAAILGAVVLLPRLGDQLSIQGNETDLWDSDEVELNRDLMHQKLSILRQDEKSLLWRRQVLLSGYTVLALSLAAAAIHLSTNINSESEPNAPQIVNTTARTAQTTN